MNNGGGGVAALTEALSTLQAAQQAVDDFEEENGDVREARDDAQAALTADIEENGSDAQLRAEVAQAEAGLSDAQDDVDAVEGLGSAIESLNAAQAEFVAAAEAGYEAQVALGAQGLAFETLNEVELSEPFPTEEEEELSWGDLEGVEPGTAVFTATVEDEDESTTYNLIVMGENGQLELADATGDFDPAALAGIDRLLADAQLTFDAAVGYADTREAFEATILDMVLAADPEFDLEAFGDLNDFYNEGSFTEAEGFSIEGIGELDNEALDDIVAIEVESEDDITLDDLYTALETANQDLADAQDAVEERAELRQDVADAEAAVAALVALEETRDEALARLEDSEEDGGLGINLADFESGSATADSDLYVFADDKGETIAITNFGAEGEDRLYFGEGYNFVQLEEDQTINNRVGSADELEIFWEETSSGLTLYVEAGAEAGRDLNTAEITTIELAGVSADDASFAGGFVTVA